jgi:metal-responsive CopG/Arc/MetJ family transcriptional regulator
MVQISIRLPTQLIAAIDKEAARVDVSRNEIIRKRLEQA